MAIYKTDVKSQLSMGWVTYRAGLGWVGSWVRNIFKILKLGRPLVTVEVIPDNLIMINTDK